MTRTGIHECRIGMPKQWSYRDSGKESTRIPIQSHENPDNIPISAPCLGSLKGSYRDSETTVSIQVYNQQTARPQKFTAASPAVFVAPTGHAQATVGLGDGLGKHFGPAPRDA